LEVEGGCYFQRIADQSAAIQIFTVQIDGRNSTVFISPVIVDSPVGIATGGIEGDLAEAIVHDHRAPRVLDGSEQVEELAYAFFFRRATDIIEFEERSLYKS